MMEFAESYKHLEVYKYAKHLAKDIFEYSKSFPREETYSLTDQVRRSSRSIGAQIAEAWGKRRYEKHFVSKLTDADGEQLETQHWIEIATTCGYIPNEMSTELTNRCISIGKMLNSMISKSAMFCRKPNETNH
ncbi:MAG: four helix bundle protein [Bacteroidota bacterium]|jgi:four helix bundle protein|nr:four helix bundle protein [Cytophagales bacterium]